MKSLASGEGGIRRRVRRKRAVLKPDRIDNPTILDLAQKLASGVYERVLLCEGDSWFDIWTPAPLTSRTCWTRCAPLAERFRSIFRMSAILPRRWQLILKRQIR
jgi:hypothetical protein